MRTELPGRLPGFLRRAALPFLLVLGACAEPPQRSDAPGLRVGDVLGSDPLAQEFARADAPRKFEFPRDHGPHPEFRSEWWYLTLALATSNGREFGVQFTLFRQAQFPDGPADDPWRNGQGYLGHFAVTDVQEGRHREAERLARGHPALAGAQAGIPVPAAEKGTPTFPQGTPTSRDRAKKGTPTLPTGAGKGTGKGTPTLPAGALQGEGTPTKRNGTPTFPVGALQGKGTPTRSAGALQGEGTPTKGDGTPTFPQASAVDVGDIERRAARGGENGVLVWLEGWQLAGDGDNWALDAAAEGFAVSLGLVATKPIILQGERGLSVKGPGQASYYYSQPRLQASGHLQIDGVSHRVAGTGWLDREWSTSVLGEHQVGWDWFALMLDNGEDIMAFRLRRNDGLRDPHDHGVLVDATGAARHLASGDFSLEPLDYWRDERGTAWPVGWILRVKDRWWRIVTPVRNQRMDTLLTYWEGLVHVLDQEGVKVGRGYMELTGYQ